MTPLHITVAVAARSEEGLTAGLSLAKCGILYGDHVRLCSLASPVLLSAIGLDGSDFDRQLDFLLSAGPSIIPPADMSVLESMIRRYWALTRHGHRTGDELQECLQLSKALNGRWRAIQHEVLSAPEQTELGELLHATRSGFLEITSFADPYDGNSVVDELVAATCDSIGSRDGHLLLDEQLGRVVRATVEKQLNEAPENCEKPGAIVGLTSDVISRLPLLDHATVAEVLNLRNELSGPLIRFRLEVKDLAVLITRDDTWDRFSELWAQAMLRQRLEPVVSEIREKIARNKRLRLIEDEPPSTSDTVVARPALGALVSTVDILSREMAKAIGIAAGAETAAEEAYLRWREGQRHVEGNRLLLYYDQGELT
jgi:hypothetical protein